MSVSLSDNVESIRDRFDDAWKGPSPPHIEDFLPPIGTPSRITLLRELIHIDLERRLTSGEGIRLEEAYLPRFTELCDDVDTLLDLLVHEFVSRRRLEPDLSPEEYSRRFPQHGDVEPSNLQLTRGGTVKLLDLGLARLEAEPATGPLTAPGQMMGTPDYVAPEQLLDSHSADARADLYSLGCTLFYLLDGEPVFPPSSHPTVARKHEGHLKESPPDVRSRRPEVPDELAKLLKRLLAKKPENRYSTAAEVAEALLPFALGSRLERQLQSQDGDSQRRIPKPARFPATVGFVWEGDREGVKSLRRDDDTRNTEVAAPDAAALEELRLWLRSLSDIETAEFRAFAVAP